MIGRRQNQPDFLPRKRTMTAPAARPLRCAVYTRKSTEHNLDLAFTSLDAQREACEAYIRSQAGEGWRLVPEHYDDGGLSGASLDVQSRYGHQPLAGLVLMGHGFGSSASRRPSPRGRAARLRTTRAASASPTFHVSLRPSASDAMEGGT
jgi:hypothetical protein